ncbi:MAG: hypothetical protein WCG47_21625 [Dermatophilaceae bacterium]
MHRVDEGRPGERPAVARVQSEGRQLGLRTLLHRRHPLRRGEASHVGQVLGILQLGPELFCVAAGVPAINRRTSSGARTAYGWAVAGSSASRHAAASMYRFARASRLRSSGLSTRAPKERRGAFGCRLNRFHQQQARSQRGTGDQSPRVW